MKRKPTTTYEIEYIYKRLFEDIKNEYGVCALMGNLKAESGLLPINVENRYNNKTGKSDLYYTNAVDSGEYTKFITDCYGYGLAQHTYKTRKKALLEYAKSIDSSIGNIDTQIEFILNELKTGYKSIYKALTTATDIRTASDIVLKKYENPKDQSNAVCVYRASLGVAIYNNLVKPTQTTKRGIVTASILNVRAKPTVTSAIINGISRGTIIEISRIVTNTEKTYKTWGYVPLFGGYVCMDYIKGV